MARLRDPGDKTLMKNTALLLCAALLLLPSTSFAAPAGSGDGAQLNEEGATVSQAGPVREVIFGDADSIEGEVLRPGGVIVNATAHRRLESMISIRGDFLPQLITLSADI